jgi:hypothetical protein
MSGSTRVDYAIEAPLTSAGEISAQVTAIDTSSVASKTVQGFREVAEAKPELAGLAEVEPVLAPPEPPTTALVVEYEVIVTEAERDETASQLSAIDGSSLSETMVTNMQEADESLAGISIAEIDEAAFKVDAPTVTPTASPTVSPTASPTGIAGSPESQADVANAGKTSAEPLQAGGYALDSTDIPAILGAAMAVLCGAIIGVGLLCSSHLSAHPRRVTITETNTTANSNVEQEQAYGTDNKTMKAETLNHGAPELPIAEQDQGGSVEVPEEWPSLPAQAGAVEQQNGAEGLRRQNSRPRVSLKTVSLAEVMADLEPGVRVREAAVTDAPVGASHAMFFCASCTPSGRDPVASSVVAGTPNP